MYINQVEDPGMIHELSADLLGAVRDSAGSGTEIIALADEPSPYQRAALAESVLLWATATEPEFVIARVFDFRTDGERIWTDTAQYYLDRHGLAPDAAVWLPGDSAAYPTLAAPLPRPHGRPANYR